MTRRVRVARRLLPAERESLRRDRRLHTPAGQEQGGQGDTRCLRLRLRLRLDLCVSFFCPGAPWNYGRIARGAVPGVKVNYVPNTHTRVRD